MDRHLLFVCQKDDYILQSFTIAHDQRLVEQLALAANLLVFSDGEPSLVWRGSFKHKLAGEIAPGIGRGRPRRFLGFIGLTFRHARRVAD